MRDVTTIPPVRADRRIAYGNDENQFIDLYESSTDGFSATIMMIHGGFWRAKYSLEHASHLCAALAKDGMNVSNVEYRRVGNAGGGWPGTFHDVVNAHAAIHTLFPDSPIIACGHSAGGHLALRLGCEENGLNGVVALAPVAMLRDAYQLHLSDDAVAEFMGGTPDERPDEYDEASPSKHALTSPAILIHGGDDDVVPISQSRDYFRLRRNDPAHFLELPGTGHMELIDPEARAFTSVAAAITDLLR
jgi:acetyl esterase/lipase